MGCLKLSKWSQRIQLLKVSVKEKLSTTVITIVVIVAVIDWNLKIFSIMKVVKGTDFIDCSLHYKVAYRLEKMARFLYTVDSLAHRLAEFLEIWIILINCHFSEKFTNKMTLGWILELFNIYPIYDS